MRESNYEFDIVDEQLAGCCGISELMGFPYDNQGPPFVSPSEQQKVIRRNDRANHYYDHEEVPPTRRDLVSWIQNVVDNCGNKVAVIATVNSEQKIAAECLKKAGFKGTGWLDRPKKQSTSIQIFTYIKGNPVKDKK